MRKKWILCIGAGVTGAALLLAALAACDKEETPASDAQYLQTLDRSDVWANDAASSVPEYRVYDHVHSFLDACVIQNGSAVSPAGKTRKVLFLGFDGMRADAALQLFESTNVFDDTLGGGR